MRFRKITRISFIIGSVFVTFACALVVFVFRPYYVGSTPGIPMGWGASRVEPFKGSAAERKTLPVTRSVPRNPHLAATNSSNMHVNSYATDAHEKGGPLGIKPTVRSYAHGRLAGECASIAFDSMNNIVAVFGSFDGFSLMLMAPDNLRVLDKVSLPPRRSSKSMNLRKIMEDTSGGAYFFLDDKDRVVLVDANQVLKIFAITEQNGVRRFKLQHEMNLLPTLKQYTDELDVVTSVLPDWPGNYWFVSRRGLVAVYNRTNGKIGAIALENEEIQNSFAIDENGAYIVSDKALYGLRLSLDSITPEVVWREEYKTAEMTKTGSITKGSGTTPTLIGDEYVAIADNAEPQISVLVFVRNHAPIDNRLVCSLPVFATNRSATENTLVSFGNSLIIENNSGYDLFPYMTFGRIGDGGIARVDFDPESAICELVWENPIVSQTTVPKLSLETGLVYVYAKDPDVGWGIDAFYLAAIDFETGTTVYEILSGTGISYDNNWAPITLGPNGCAYVGVLRGLVQICDEGVCFGQ